MNCPPDAAAVSHRYAADGFGACGPCAAAALIGTLRGNPLAAADVLDVWREVHGEDYPGYGGNRKLRAVVEDFDFDTLQQPAKPHNYSWPKLDAGQCALVAVVWHPRDEWVHWMEKASHWVALVQTDEEAIVYCNGFGRWRPLSNLTAEGYLDGAHVSSYLLVSRREE